MSDSDTRACEYALHMHVMICNHAVCIRAQVDNTKFTDFITS